MSSSNKNNNNTSNSPAFTNIFRQANLTKQKPIPIINSNNNNQQQQQNTIINSSSTRTPSRNINNNNSFVDENNFYLNPKLEDDLYNGETNNEPPLVTKQKFKNSFYDNHRRQASYETNIDNNYNNNSSNSPLSKTPDSSTDIGNWIDVPDSGKCLFKI